MKTDPTMPDRRMYPSYPLVAWILAVCFLAFLVFRPFLLVFTVAASVAILLAPVNRRIAARLRGRQGLASALTVLLVVLLMLLPLLGLGWMVVNQALEVTEQIKPHLEPEAIERLWSEELPARYPKAMQALASAGYHPARMKQMIAPALSGAASGIKDLAQAAIQKAASVAFNVTVFVFLLFFLLRDGDDFGRALRRISPLNLAQETAILESLSRTIQAVLQSMVVVPIVQGLLAMIGFAVFGVPAPFFWGAALIVAAVIPGIGSPLIWAPAAGYLFLIGENGRGLGMLLYGVLVINMIDNILKPMLLSGTARIHTALGFLASLGGMIAFGISGFLVGPVILSLVLSAIRIYELDILARREGPAPP